MSKERIEYIDLAKGICIILVVALHCQTGNGVEVLACLRMPFYFFISGMFFKDYGGLKYLLVKKINKLVIPFFFYYILIWLFHWTLQTIKPGFWSYPGSFWKDFWSNNYMNAPIWFLLCLFWCNILYFFIQRHKVRLFIPIFIIFSAIIGCVLSYNNCHSPFYVYQTLLAMPFFYLGQKLKFSHLIKEKSSWLQFVIAILFIILSLLIDRLLQDRITFQEFTISGNAFFYYIKALLMIIATILLCKVIKRLPIISYCGRYSIIILGTHTIYREIAYHIPNWIGDSIYNNWIQFCFVLIMSIASIPIFTQFFPYFTAQQDLIDVSFCRPRSTSCHD